MTSSLKKSTEPSVLYPGLWQQDFSSIVELWFISCCVGVLSYGETQSLAVEQQHAVGKGWDTRHIRNCMVTLQAKGQTNPGCLTFAHIC